MATDIILALLVTERDKLSKAIEALQGPTAPHEMPSGSDRKAVVPPVEQASKPVVAAAPTPPAKRKLSAAGRSAIIAATKARWARIKAAKAAVAAPKTKTKAAIIAEGVATKEDADFKARMSAAMKASWAKRKRAATKKKALSTN